jgi:crotonobetaine/carnitine-CoA ligase
MTVWLIGAGLKRYGPVLAEFVMASGHHPVWFDPRPMAADDAVIPRILRRWSGERPEAPCVQFDDGMLWSYRQTWQEAQNAAAALSGLGVSRGDVVLVWLPNNRTFVRTWYGLGTLGAVHTPLNVAFRGAILEHVIRNSRATVMIAHHELVPRLAGLDLSNLQKIVVCGGPVPQLDVKPELLPETALQPTGAMPPALPELESRDLAAVLYTSGTTGFSKGVKIPYAQLATAGQVAHGYLRPNDRIYIFTPLFHTVGISAVFATLTNGACFHLAEYFRAQTFWQDISRTGCNRILGLISSMTSYLVKAVQSSGGCPFDFAMMSPITAETTAFAARQKFDYFAAYSMTETSVPILSGINAGVFGSCGRPRSGVTCRLVDESGVDVVDGEAGELIVKADDPLTMNQGYLNDPEATAKAWRDGWFHTGDAFRRDANGNFFFVDRLKDAIRRRGENVSSVEVELEIAAYPGVMEVAVIAARSPYGDDEVMAVIAPAPGQSVDPAQLIAFLTERLAHFMIPRYVRIVEALPKTPTNKIKKSELRSEVLPPDTWDREAHGIQIRRQQLA